MSTSRKELADALRQMRRERRSCVSRLEATRALQQLMLADLLVRAAVREQRLDPCTLRPKTS